jgi:hypothetical protein
MRSTLIGGLQVSAVLLGAVWVGAQQERRSATDPRVGLKAGVYDAGEAILHLQRITTVPRPEGFFDPKEPAGPPWRQREETPAAGGAATPTNEAVPPDAGPGMANRMRFWNSDAAFNGDLLFLGSYHGFTVYDIERAEKPQLRASVVCPGGQGDVSIYGNLLFVSVEETRGRVDCGIQGVQAPASGERFRGVRIFDVRDLSNPRQVAAVQTCRGSHTHTLVTDPKDKSHVYIYGSGIGAVRSGEELTGCSALDRKEDPNTALFSIDVIKVPLAAPSSARIVNRPRVFADPKTGNMAGLWPGGDHGPGTQTSRITAQCHDITVFPELGLAAGACAGNGILMDISDPVNPVRLDQVVDKNVAYWHSATFNHDGTKVVFADEWGGGGRPRCRAEDPLYWGGDAIYDIVDRKLVFRSYYNMPAVQTEQENCVAHSTSIVPVPGRDIIAQAFLQGGISVFDFTDSARPVEIAYFDRGPYDANQLVMGGHWLAYWYNGHIFASEFNRGLDVFKLLPSEHITQNEIDAASLVRWTELNAQVQSRIVWPATPEVARAYIDQLTRTNGILPERASAVRTALDRADERPAGRELTAAANRLRSLASQLERDAAETTGRDAVRLRSLAATIKGRAEGMR